MQESIPARKARLLLELLILFSCTAQAIGQQQDFDAEDDFTDMSIEELMEMDTVVSASRQAQKMSELSVPVSVITSEDIHNSGLTTIPEILRFTCGVDVLQFDRNRFAVGVRGLHDPTSDRTLVLVNGRAANNPGFGGMEWEKLPLLLEDIDRIEVVRGPGGAVWGANAFTGVINIITKKPEDVLGGFGSTTINEFGDTYTHLRLAEEYGKWIYRVSAGYEDRESSDDAGAGNYESGSTAVTSIPSVGYGTFSARDFARNWRFDSEAVYRYSEQTAWTGGLAYSNFNGGDYAFMGYFPKRNVLTNMTRAFSRIDHDFDNGSSGYVQWFGNYNVTHAKMWTDRYYTGENDIEAQLNFTLGDKHDISIGGNLRLVRVNVDATSAQSAFLNGDPLDETWGWLFLVDRFAASERLILEGQVRADRYSGTESDWSARSSALYALDHAKEHVVRVSAAKAFRAPTAGLRKASLSRIPLGGPLYLVNYLLPHGDLKNEETWSLEAGYTGKLSDDLKIRVDTYYQRFTHLIGAVVETTVPTITSRLDNIDGATGYGVECELSKEHEWGKISAWYAYNGLRTDQGQQQIRSFYPAKHKVGLTSRLHLARGWTLNTNYSFNTAMKSYGNSLVDIGTSNRLDLGLAKKFAKGKGEFMMGVNDVLNKTNDPVFSAGTYAAHDLPGRTFFARMQFNF